MSRVVEPDAFDVVGMHGRPPVRRSSNAWGEVDAGSPGDDDSRSARSDSQYTDADSVASDAFESGAEDISDDESSRPRGSRADAADALARDVRDGLRFEPRADAHDGDVDRGERAETHHLEASASLKKKRLQRGGDARGVCGVRRGRRRILERRGRAFVLRGAR
jgi:hypothetical protein